MIGYFFTSIFTNGSGKMKVLKNIFLFAQPFFTKQKMTSQKLESNKGSSGTNHNTENTEPKTL